MGIAPDWGNGAYEVFAPQLIPAAEYLVEIANPQPGERAIDLGCGSGNATIPLAQRGVHVTAVDPSLRLLAIAAERARAEGIRITTALARAEQLPLPDNDADLVISNFGVIFSSEPATALSETLRVLTPTGRFLFTSWLPDGPLDAVRKLLMHEVMPGGGPAQPATDGSPAAIVWHEPHTYAHLVPGGEAAVTIHTGDVAFTADSAEAWLEQQQTFHPVWLAAKAALGDGDRWPSLMDQSVEVLTAASTDRERLAITAPYAIIEIKPQA